MPRLYLTVIIVFTYYIKPCVVYCNVITLLHVMYIPTSNVDNSIRGQLNSSAFAGARSQHRTRSNQPMLATACNLAFHSSLYFGRGLRRGAQLSRVWIRSSLAQREKCGLIVTWILFFRSTLHFGMNNTLHYRQRNYRIIYKFGSGRGARINESRSFARAACGCIRGSLLVNESKFVCPFIDFANGAWRIGTTLWRIHP